MSTSSLWRNPDFLKLWTGQAISELGSRITREGLPLTAVMVLEAGPAQVGLLSALGGVAVLVGGLPAGVWVDRWRRRPVLIVTDLGRAAALAVIPLAFAQGWLTLYLLFGVALVAGLLTVLFDVAYQSYLPALVERERLLEGNAKLALTASTAEILGPALTGLLIQVITAPRAILFDAISFLGSAVAVALIRTPEPPPPPASKSHLLAEIREGLHAVRTHPILRPLALRSASAYLAFGASGALYTLFALRDLRLSPVALGLVIAVGGVSNLIGALYAERLRTRLGLRWTFLGSALLLGLAMTFIPLAGGTPLRAALFLGAAQLIGDMAGVAYYINEVSVRQQVTAERLLGRVNAAMQLVSRGMLPIGALLGGLLAEAAGVRTTMAVATAGVLLSSLWLVRLPDD